MIKLKNLTTGYSRDKPIMTEMNYEFKDNMFYCVLGKSGCGKTTMLRTLAGLLKPISGELFRDEEVLSDFSDIYMMHQNYTSFNWLTVKENVLIAKKIHQKINAEDEKECEEILISVGLAEHMNKFPTQLSGGQRQRLSLARMLFAKPKIVLMDEPLSALDGITRKQMQELIIQYHKKNQGIIIMITHSEDEANLLADKKIKL